MNLPLDKLQKLKRSHKLGILFGTVVLLGVAFYFGLFSPMQTKITGLNNDITGLETKIKQHRAKVKQYGEIQKRIARLEDELEALSEFIPPQKEVGLLLDEISKHIADSGLNQTLFQPNPKDKITDHYAEISFQMRVEGPYLNVAQFFYKTSRMARIVNIDNIKMDKPELKDGELVLSTSCTGKTYRFLTAAEKKAREDARKAAQKKRQ